MSEIRVFISSVQTEFSAERKQLYDYIQQDALLGQFFTPFIFEKLPAVDMTAQQAYLNEAAECDIEIMGTSSIHTSKSSNRSSIVSGRIY